MDAVILHELFDYRDGTLYWKKTVNKKVKQGDKAGTFDNEGYVVVRYKGKGYKAHRLVFLMFNGYLPDQIDHIDCDKSNNKIENLRPACSVTNHYNVTATKRNTTGVKNVYFVKKTNRWRVAMVVNKQFMSFGCFQDLELAELVAQEARIKYHGKYANHGVHNFPS